MHHHNLALAMSFRPDITVDSPAGESVLVVECKVVRDARSTDAAAVRRNPIVHGQVPIGAFFLLALPTTFLMWNPGADITAASAFTASAESVLKDYLGAIVDREGGPREESLELAITSWLADLVDGLRKPVDSSDADSMLVASGVYDRIKGGYVRTGLDP